MDIWAEIQNLEGRTLQTLDHQKPFDIVEVTDTALVVMPHETAKKRPIQRDVFENAYRRLIASGQLTRNDIHAEFSEFNPAYVAAILAELQGVTHTTRPIALRFRDRRLD